MNRGWAASVILVFAAGVAGADEPCPVPGANSTPDQRKAYAVCWQSVQRDQRRYASDAARLTDSCADIASLRAIAGEVVPSVARAYLDEADRREKRQAAQIKAVTAELFAKANGWTVEFFSEGDTPDGARGDIEGTETPRVAIPAVKERLERARCYSDTEVTRADAVLDKLSALMESAIADEAKCRATPSCMGARIAVNVCGWIASRKDALREIASEKANPGGVVDLVKLHDLGQSVQALDGRIGAGKADYVRATHKTFSETACAR
jgi:hypothetical protein